MKVSERIDCHELYQSKVLPAKLQLKWTFSQQIQTPKRMDGCSFELLLVLLFRTKKIIFQGSINFTGVNDFLKFFWDSSFAWLYRGPWPYEIIITHFDIRAPYIMLNCGKKWLKAFFLVKIISVNRSLKNACYLPKVHKKLKKHSTFFSWEVIHFLFLIKTNKP